MSEQVNYDPGQVLEALNNKVDVDLDNLGKTGWSNLLSGMAPSTRFISLSLAAQTYFQAPANGYIEFRMNKESAYGQVLMYAEGDEEKNNPVFNSGIPQTTPGTARGMFYIGKGQLFTYNSADNTQAAVLFRYALGEK